MALINYDSSTNDSFDLLSDVENWYEETQLEDCWEYSFSWVSKSDDLHELEEFLSPVSTINNFTEYGSVVNAKRCLLYDFNESNTCFEEIEYKRNWVSALSHNFIDYSLYELEDFLSIGSSSRTIAVQP